jgi:excinuclease UvrABC helicase subunit UvrB
MSKATADMQFEKCIQLRSQVQQLEEARAAAEAAAAAGPADNSAEISRIEGEIERIKQEMQAATAAMEFEKCMKLRDELQVLEKQKADLA